MTKNEYQQRPFNEIELIKQIGQMNFYAISGGRIKAITNEQGETVEVILPVGKGYLVAITLGWNDTYIVRRVYGWKKPRTKGIQTDVYCEDIGEVAYKASCFVNVPFGEEVKA